MSQRESYKILLPRLPRVYPGLSRWGGVSHCWSTRAWSGTREGDVSPQLQEGRTPLYVAKELQQRGGMGQHCKPNCALILFTIIVNFELYIPKYYPFFLSHGNPDLQNCARKNTIVCTCALHMRSGTSSLSTKSSVRPPASIYGEYTAFISQRPWIII